MVRNYWARVLLSGTAASLASALALALAGRREVGSAATPLNGPSQWVWGRHAPYRDGFSVRHTVVGYGIHHFASVFWAALFERARRARPALPAAIATAALACVVDYRCTPQRFTPGFEKRLSRAALLATYAAFAAGLALASRGFARRTPSSAARRPPRKRSARAGSGNRRSRRAPTRPR
jgi:hypothetical protein